MELFPAIDLRAGRCVRLAQGDFGRETVYGTEPVERAKAFEAAGARWVHVVDLDAVRSGVATNRPVIADIAAAVGIAVQAGGGVRRAEDVAGLLDAGISSGHCRHRGCDPGGVPGRHGSTVAGAGGRRRRPFER